MAEGRLVNKRIGMDKAVGQLASDTCRLAFTWAIPYLDRDGRCTGDPAALRSLVFPRRDDISTETMRGFIADWAEHELVKWYEANGDLYLEFPSFRKNQPNLRHDREPASAIPPSSHGQAVSFSIPVSLPQSPTEPAGVLPADCRQDAGEHPAEVSKEVEVKEVMNEVRESQKASPPAASAVSRPAGRPADARDGEEPSQQLEPSVIPLDGLPKKLRRDIEAARRRDARREAAKHNGKPAPVPASPAPYAARGAPPERDDVGQEPDYGEQPDDVFPEVDA